MPRFLRSLLRRRLRAVVLLALLACGGTSVAYGYLTATSQQGDTVPEVRSRSLSKPAAPAASVSGSTVTVSITQDSIDAKKLGDYAGGGYLVRRHTWDGTNLGSATTPTTGTCKDLVAGSGQPLTCTDTSAPAGSTYRYTAVPALNLFRGPASDPSSGVTPAAASVAAPTDLAASPAAPTNSTTPTITGKATAGSTVKLFTDSSCTTTAKNASGAAVSGTADSSGNFSLTATVTANTTTFHATATLAGVTSTCSTTSATFVNDTTAPTAAGIKGVNGGSSTAGVLGAGDSIEYVFSEEMKKTSILSSWTGTTAPVTVRISNAGSGNGNSDTLQVVSGGAAVATLGTVDTKGDYVVNNTDFNATLTQAGATVKVTLESVSGTAALQTKTVPKGAMVWAFGPNMTDLAGNPLSAGSFTGASVVNF